MFQAVRTAILGALLPVALAAGPALADNPGQEDLDKATEAKVTARTLSDLSEVIRLCESAQKKGLDEQNAAFAKRMLASTLIQRGLTISKNIFDRPAPDLQWSKFRDAALVDLEKGAQLDPQQPEAFYHIARLNLLPGGNVKRAAEALDEAIRAAADAPEVRAKSLVLRAGLKEDVKQRRADLDEAVRAAPRDASAVLARGLLLAEIGELDSSLADLRKAIELEPERGPVYEALAMVLAEQKKYDEALASLQKARQLQPDSVGPLKLQARIHALQSKFDAALEDLDQAYAMEPGDVSVLLLRAGVYQELGQKEKALADADRALKLKPGLAPAKRIRAMLLAGEGKVEQAISELEQFRETNPKDLWAVLQLGMLYGLQRKYEKAIATYSALLADAPGNATALRCRADALLGLGKHAEAVADYERALKIEPEDAGVLNNLAWVLATSPNDKLRNGPRAVKLATEACRLTQYKQAHILSTLAAAYAESGDFESAMQWSQKAVTLGSEEQKEALSKELESYKARKPWREALLTEQPEKPEKKTEGEKGKAEGGKGEAEGEKGKAEGETGEAKGVSP